MQLLLYAMVLIMNLLFLTYGPTHSGKTTFGAKLLSALGESAKFIHIDNDAVDEFIKTNYGNLRADPQVRARRTPSDPDLRLRIPQQIADYALREGYSVIATAAHPKQQIRQTYYDIANINGAKVVLLIFKLSDEQAGRRIEANNRDTGILDMSPDGEADFQSLFNKQKIIMEEPSDAEKAQCYKVLEITEQNASDMLNNAIALLA